MLTIKTGSLKQFIVDVNGLRFNVYQVIVCDENGKIQHLQDCTNFVALKEIEIISRRWCLTRKLNISLSIKQGIVKFLNCYHAQQKLFFDCYSFVNMVYGVKQHKKKFLKDFWNIKPYRWRSKVGDVIFLVNKKENYFYHAAIYIGFGLYISAYGAGGDLEISTLKDMRKDFGAERVLKATLRK